MSVRQVPISQLLYTYSSIIQHPHMLPEHTRRKHETSAMAARPHIAAEILPMVCTIAYNCTFIPAENKFCTVPTTQYLSLFYYLKGTF
jgi:hypothetical protein